MTLNIISMSIKSQTMEALTDTSVIYYDYNPDSYIYDCITIGSLHHGDTFKIDLNNDTIYDIKFYFVPYLPSYPYMPIIQTMNNNTKWAIFPVSYSDSLSNPSLTWRDSSNFYSSFRVGIRITSGANYYYGWVRTLSASQDYNISYFLIYEYAFCKIPDYPFLWGQTQIITHMMEINSDNSEKVMINQNNNLLFIQSKAEIKNVTITSISGAKVFLKSTINSNTTEINTDNLASGIYIVKVEHKDGSTFTKQIVK